MKAIIFSVLLLSISIGTKAQKQVQLQNLSKHIGDSVLVAGKVYGVQTASNGKLLLLSVGGRFPNQLLTIVLTEELQKILQEPLKREIQEITLAGKVELVKGQPQMVISKPEQIQRITTEKITDKEN